MTRQTTRLTVWALALTLAGGTSLAAQQQAPATAAGPAQIPQAPTQGTAPLPTYVVGQAKPPDMGRPVLTLTVDDAVSRALEHNLNLQSARLNPQMQDYQLQQLRAAYRPTLTGTFGYNSSTTQSTSTIEGGSIVNANGQTYNTGVSQLLPWGEQLNLGFNNSRSYTTASISSYNPSFKSGVSFSATQSLLANRSIDSTRVGIKTQQLTDRITDVALKAQVADTIAQVREAYWGLRGAIETIEIDRQSVVLAQRLVSDNDVKVQIGTMAPLDALSAKLQEAQAEQTLQAAIASWQTKELAFKVLIASGTDDDSFKDTLDPVDQLDVTEVTPDIPAAITKALAGRTDVEQQKLTLESADWGLKLAENQLLPSLNLTGNYSLSGVGGPQLQRTGLTGSVTSTLPGGYGDALTSLASNPAWSLTVNLSYPVGMASARASLARQRLSFDQSKLTLKTLEFTVASDLTNAGLNVTNAYTQFKSAQLSRQIAEQNYQAEQSKFDVGLDINYNVILALNSLNQARNSELNAEIAYITALIEFERLQSVK